MESTAKPLEEIAGPLLTVILACIYVLMYRGLTAGPTEIPLPEDRRAAHYRGGVQS